MSEQKEKKVLVVHEKAHIVSYVSQKLTSWGCKVDTSSSGFSAMEKIGYFSYFAIFISASLPLTNYKDLTRRIAKEYPGIYIIVLDADSRVTENDFKESSSDFLIPDPMDDHLLNNVFSEMAGRRTDLRKYFEDIPLIKCDFERMIGTHPRMKEIYQIIEKLSRSSVSVLILGESGTGKELTAKAIHYSGERKNAPFIAVSCAAIPEGLLESELFGHEKGAFTGAVAQKIGKFEQSNRGTIFLDEIAEMSPSLQAKLLRVVEESEFQRVGGNDKIKVDTRIISATNKDLWEMSQKGQFRQDLYFRLSAFPIHLPTLRERRSDIPGLVRHFIRLHHKRAGKDLCTIDKKALDLLVEFEWKGNIRELENVIERSLVMCEGGVIKESDIPDYIRSYSFEPSAPAEKLHPNEDPAMKPIENLEKEAMIKALQYTAGNQSAAARQLKMNLLTFYRKIKKYNISINRIK